MYADGNRRRRLPSAYKKNLMEEPAQLKHRQIPANKTARPAIRLPASLQPYVASFSFVAGSVGAGDGDGGSEGGGRVRAGGRARGSAEDGAVPLTGRRCRCRARRGWCRARCGGGLRGMPLLRIQGRLPRRVRAERAHPQSGMIHKLCY